MSAAEQPPDHDREYLRKMAMQLHAQLPDNHGFILLTFPFGQPDGRMNYTAHCDRAEAIKVLKGFLFSLGEGENWMRHIK